MNGYVEAGYVVVLGTLSAYSATLVVRERAARMRLGSVSRAAATKAPARGTPGGVGEDAGLEVEGPIGEDGLKAPESSP